MIFNISIFNFSEDSDGGPSFVETKKRKKNIARVGIFILFVASMCVNIIYNIKIEVSVSKG